MCARTRGRGRAGPPAREPWPNANGSIQKFLRLRTLTLAPPCVPKGAAQRSCWGEGARTHEHPRTEWAPCERVSAQPLSRPPPLLPSNPSMVLLPSPSPLSCPPRGLPALLSGACSRSHRPTPKIKKFRRRGGGGGSAALPRPPRPPPSPLLPASLFERRRLARTSSRRRPPRSPPRSPRSAFSSLPASSFRCARPCARAAPVRVEAHSARCFESRSCALPARALPARPRAIVGGGSLRPELALRASVRRARAAASGMVAGAPSTAWKA